MLFAATHMRPANMCPLNKSEGRKMLKDLFSEENMRKAGVKVTSANMSCPISGPPDHKGYFIVEAKDATTVTRFFGPMTVEVREVKPWSEVSKTI